MSEDEVARRREVIREAIHRVSCDRRASHDAAFGQCSVSADAVAMDLTALSGAAGLREALTSILDNATEDDCTSGFYDALRAALSGVPEGAASDPRDIPAGMTVAQWAAWLSETWTDEAKDAIPAALRSVPSPEPLDWTAGHLGLAEDLHAAWLASGRPELFGHDMEAWRGFALALRAVQETKVTGYARLAAPQPVPEDKS